ncbi:MAG: copper resistance CopC family protein [Brachybacterium sp.]|uniref:copper resistance CopC family protein n=1 Tax=Brachybacterium sp. TaxID=1891286 RepID=UPI00264B1658|nr:copper resistance protein CopC [Brachybacterium sp.]MDN6303996.1 copper resistance protein CopC [Brachybacterium sp.]MDN6330104.1 copper resistance protein CopC [Brachybacterium sp.]MDN6400938.1 copper resistance protein CopC [Brachybacterium sp.]
MKQLISRPAVRPSSALALCVALLLAAILAMPAPAQAHDTLLSTDPVDGSTLETSPEEVTFTFSSDILDVSPLVRVSDEAGDEIAEIVPTVEGPTATATLDEPLAAGTYDIQWRVVSSDGHPIEGTLSLTVEQDPAVEELTAPSDGGGESAEGGGEESPQELPTATGDVAAQGEAETTAATDSPQDGGLSMPVLLGVLAVIVVGVVITVFVIMRRRD